MIYLELTRKEYQFLRVFMGNMYEHYTLYQKLGDLCKDNETVSDIILTEKELLYLEGITGELNVHYDLYCKITDIVERREVKDEKRNSERS